MKKVSNFSISSGVVVALLTVLPLFNHHSSSAQEIGVSASFFLPKDGYFSAPISPISFRGIGINIEGKGWDAMMWRHNLELSNITYPR